MHKVQAAKLLEIFSRNMGIAVGKSLVSGDKERGEEISVVAGGEILDFLLEDIGKEIYKKGALDAKKLVKEKMEDLEMELDLLSEKEN